MDSTNEFSFILKPAKHGVGVFAVHDIKEGMYLRLFRDEGLPYNIAIDRNIKDVPKLFHSHCVSRGEVLKCPSDFGRMEIGWYLNHSETPNAYHIDYIYRAKRDIKSGEEITIDYNSLEEPEEVKEDYYKK